MGAKDGHRLARLDEKCLVSVHRLQAVKNGVKALPIAGSLASSAVHHQVLRAFGDFWIEVVLDHPVWRFELPGLAVKLGTARGSHDFGHGLTSVDNTAIGRQLCFRVPRGQGQSSLGQ